MTVDEIYGQMVQIFQQETGLTLAGDGDMAVRLYAAAAQIYALYVQADWVERQCFPQSALGGGAGPARPAAGAGAEGGRPGGGDSALHRRGGVPVRPGHSGGDGVHDSGAGAF